MSHIKVRGWKAYAMLTADGNIIGDSVCNESDGEKNLAKGFAMVPVVIVLGNDWDEMVAVLTAVPPDDEVDVV